MIIRIFWILELKVLKPWTPLSFGIKILFSFHTLVANTDFMDHLSDSTEQSVMSGTCMYMTRPMWRVFQCALSGTVSIFGCL